LNESHIPAIRDEIQSSIAVKQALLEDNELLAQLSFVVDVCAAAYRRGNKLLLAGNGGSAADAQHLAAEFVNRYAFGRPGLPAIALTTDSSMLTSIANDSGYEAVFARQLEANGAEGDVFIGISTSGRSPNILAALKQARVMGITTVGLTGHAGGQLPAECDYCLRVPSDNTARVQEAHILLGHTICGLVERELFPADAP
jgi:D-sedoheptulose 7-phosphate isomerase